MTFQGSRKLSSSPEVNGGEEWIVEDLSETLAGYAPSNLCLETNGEEEATEGEVTADGLDL